MVYGKMVAILHECTVQDQHRCMHPTDTVRHLQINALLLADPEEIDPLLPTGWVYSTRIPPNTRGKLAAARQCCQTRNEPPPNGRPGRALHRRCLVWTYMLGIGRVLPLGGQHGRSCNLLATKNMLGNHSHDCKMA